MGQKKTPGTNESNIEELADGNDEIAEAIRLYKVITDPQKARAKTVFDAITGGLHEMHLSEGEDYFDARESRLNGIVRENLDAYSIHDFLLLCGVSISKLRESVRVKALSDGGKKGAKSKHELSNELKDWSLKEAKKLKGSPTAKARQLMKMLPDDLHSRLQDAGEKLRDPERVIRDALMKQRKDQ